MQQTARLLVICALALPMLALAQGALNTNTDSSTKPVRPMQSYPPPGPYSKDAAKERNDAWQNTMAEKKASTTNFIKARHEELKNAFGEQREAILNKIGEKREELKLLFNSKRASTTDMIRQKKEALTDEVQKRRADTIERYYAKASEMLQNRIDRLSAIIDKFAERLENLEDERGIDLSEASELLSQAQALLDEASAKIDELSNYAVDAVEGEGSSAAAQAMKTLRQEVWSLIKEAHQKLTEAVRVVKAALGTTTATTTPTQ